MRRVLWWDRSLWWYACRPGGYDGYRTIRGRRLPAATMQTALTRPDKRGEIRRIAAPAKVAGVDWRWWAKAARDILITLLLMLLLCAVLAVGQYVLHGHIRWR